MKEVTFIRQNIEKWREAEKVVASASQQSPDHLADIYMELTADLAFSQTHYPDSRITIYLNNLAAYLHQILYRNKREKLNRIVNFWKYEIPLAMYENRKNLLLSFIVFLISAVIGILSALGDGEFCRIILGDRYVEMTLNNIEKGIPMDVYGSRDPFVMFLSITWNNIRVAFNCFIAGLFTSIATGFILLYNGIMVGSFQTFFFQHGVVRESLLTIWQHGTLEIWVIIVAGSAGFSMGNGWLFPGTFSRLESFKRGAKRGLKIIIGTIPVFILAGFIESFQTRNTGQHILIRLLVIILSLSFIIYYYIILPKRLNHGNRKENSLLH